MKRSALMLLLFVPVALAADKIGDAEKAEMKKLEGLWDEVAVEENGKVREVKKGARDARQWQFAKDRVVVTKGGAKQRDTDYQVVAADKDPKQICIYHYPDGVFTIQAYSGIYELDGDTLKICLADPATPNKPAVMPKEFKSGKGIRVYTLKRASRESMK